MSLATFSSLRRSPGTGKGKKDALFEGNSALQFSLTRLFAAGLEEIIEQV